MIIAGLSFQGAALILVAHFVREHGVSWKEAFGLANQRRPAIMLGVILACLFLPLGMGLQWLSAQVMIHLPHLQLKPQEQESVQTLQLAVTWFNRLALAGVTIVLAPAAEEMLFRGVLYPWIKQAGLKSDDFLFPSRIHDSPHLGTRQYARILEGWVEELGLVLAEYGTHSMRRTKATLIYRRTKNLRAVQLLLGHSDITTTTIYTHVARERLKQLHAKHHPRG